MKPKTAFLSLIMLSCLCAGSALMDGCGTTAATKLAQGEKVIITSVNLGVHQIVDAINAGKLTQKQCDKFKLLYTDYYNAQMVAKAAIEKLNAASASATADDANRANAAVAAAEKALLDFINSVLHP